MARFIIRRLLLGIPVVLGVVTIVFIVARVIPGDPCRAALQEKANAATCAAFNERFGLTEPLPVQFAIYLRGLVTGDLGESIKTGQKVTEIFVERFPTTVELTILALVFAVSVGLTLGIVSAYRRNSAGDVGTMVVANLGVSIPVFVLGLLLAFIFAIILKDTPFALPPQGRLSPGAQPASIAVVWGLKDLSGPPRTALDFLSNMYIINSILTLNANLFFDAIRHLILPAIALGTIPMAIIARMTRSSLLEVMSTDGVEVHVSLPTLGAVMLSGGSNGEVSGVTGSELAADLSGGSRMSATGTIANLTVTASGGSRAELQQLPAATVAVNLSGGSVAIVQASDEVQGSASGGAALTVAGEATLNVQATGGATVVRQ